jgi:hypothetical protein
LGRRRHHRINWGHHDLEPILLEVEEPGTDWRQIDCTLVDLGAGGLGLLAAEPLDPDSRVRVTFPLPSRLGREPHHTEDDAFEAALWSSLGLVVHKRHTPDPVHDHIPLDSHRPHHHGVRFHELEQDAELRLMSALYGPMPEGWGVERYTTRPLDGRNRTQGVKGGQDRYAVVQDGKRVAWGFSTYDHARARAWSMHMDEVALASRRGAPRMTASG